MKNIEAACYALVASAFLLTATLVVQLQNGRGQFLQEANAEMVLTKANLTIMAGRTKDDEEAIFVIENQSQTLMIYLLDLTKKQLDLKQSRSLAEMFGSPSRANSSNNDSTTPRGRVPR